MVKKRSLQKSRYRVQQINANNIGDCENNLNSMAASGSIEHNTSRIEEVNEGSPGSNKGKEQP